MYSEGAGNPTNVEFLGPDGNAVVGEADLSKQKVDDYFAGREHTGPKLGYWETPTELTHAKRVAWESVQEARRLALKMESDVTALFNDRSK
jgi:hypothetical protein